MKMFAVGIWIPVPTLFPAPFPWSGRVCVGVIQRLLPKTTIRLDVSAPRVIRLIKWNKELQS
jgi:hypothetical protein